ncbi:MAG: hypothetical protein ACR2KK_16635 [Acidimicrobiales bacterium]
MAAALKTISSRLRRSAPLDLLRQSGRVSPGLAALAGGSVVISGLLPAALSLASGALANAVASAVGQDLSSGAGHRVLVALLVTGGVYVVIQVVGPLRASVADMLMRRVDAALTVRLMRAVSDPRGIAHLEDPVVLDQVAQAQGALTGAAPGTALPFLCGLWTLRLQGLAALVILSRFRWWLPLVLVAGQAASLSWRRRHWTEVTDVVFSRGDGLRQAAYLRRLAVRPDAAKETQVFSLAGWLVDRYRVSFLDTMRPVWRERRSGGWTALGVSLALLVLEGGALLLVVRAGTSAAIDLGATVVYAQVVLATAALGRFDMDNLRMEEGLASLKVLRDLERAVPAAVERMGGHLPADGLPARVIRFEGGDVPVSGARRQRVRRP